MRAIIVDDSRAMRVILSKILAKFGFETFEAVHGRDALEKLASGAAPDLALVDWNMPEMNGLELVTAIRTKADLDQMKVMMVTTEAELTRIAAALDAGANEYVMKPFTPEVFEEKLMILGLRTEVTP